MCYNVIDDLVKRGFHMDIQNSIINKENPIPYYKQIADWIRERVLTKDWKVNYQLSSENDLSLELGVSRGTIRRAISDLIDEGILIQIQGKGTFVANQNKNLPFGQELISFAESMVRNGLKFETKVLELETIIPNKLLKEKFNLEEKQKLVFLKRLRFVENEPVILIENYINPKLCLGIEKVDFEISTLFNSIEELSGRKITFGERKFNACGLDEERADLLDLLVGTPILHLDQITYLDDISPVESSNVWIKSDKYTITSRLHR